MFKSTAKPTSSTKPTKTSSKPTKSPTTPTKPASTPTKSPASVTATTATTATTVTTPTKAPEKVNTPANPVVNQPSKPVVKKTTNQDPKTNTPQPAKSISKETPKPPVEENSVKPVKQVAKDIETKVMKEKQENQPTNIVKPSTETINANGKPVTKPPVKPPVDHTTQPNAEGDTNATSKKDSHQILFAWTPEGAEKVQISGTFNHWKEKLDMNKKGAKHELSIPLNPGKYSYKFIVDGEWCYDFTAPNECDDEGNVNNVITV